MRRLVSDNITKDVSCVFKSIDNKKRSSFAVELFLENCFMCDMAINY